MVAGELGAKRLGGVVEALFEQRGEPAVAVEPREPPRRGRRGVGDIERLLDELGGLGVGLFIDRVERQVREPCRDSQKLPAMRNCAAAS